MNSTIQRTETKPKPIRVEIVSVKRCPVCGRRLCDKLTACTGTIAMKCSKCGTVSELNMVFRLACGM